eukprot:CAMPEP_0196189308 /NCGR_PEP_ID=MMETSP0911-20130528/44040_1 /TAXON_ID=49265 /ORGANISM="Thalassiosira rotula, Strain GSO102" /LENGTH=99 /DNA_ID=CAMNT_0041460871 /DNA_START=141 /DNA_END=437 /DNA_ORIENTATION=-
MAAWPSTTEEELRFISLGKSKVLKNITLSTPLGKSVTFKVKVYSVLIEPLVSPGGGVTTKDGPAILTLSESLASSSVLPAAYTNVLISNGPDCTLDKSN